MLQLSKSTKSMVNIGNVSLIGHIDKTHKCPQNNYSRSQRMCFCEHYAMDSKTNESNQKRKTVRIPKITLIHPDKSITVTILEEAEKLAKRRRLQLVEVHDKDSKSNRGVYKLLKSTEYLQDGGKNDEIGIQELHSKEANTKATKLFTIKSNIEHHDLNIKINNINKLLTKGFKIKIKLVHSDGEQENILKKLNEGIEGTMLSQKSQNAATILTFSALSGDYIDSSSECEVHRQN